MQNRPTNLVLAKLHQGVYRDNTACAYLYYGSAEEPRDHEGNLIQTFMEEEMRLALESHCENNLAPLLKNGLANTDYNYLHIDYLNMAPHPHFVIARKDNAILSEADLKQLRHHLIKIINNKNNNINSFDRGPILSLLFGSPQTIQETKNNAINDNHNINSKKL